MCDDQPTAVAGFDGISFFIDDCRNDPRQRFGATPWLCRNRTGQRAHHDPARFCLPPSINDRTLFVSNFFVVPHPRFRIDAFADCTEHTQTRQIVFVHVLVAPFDKRADRGRSGIEDRDFVLLNQIPKPILGWEVRRTFKHQTLRARSERTVNDVTVPGDPAAVRRTPIDVVVLMIEDPLERFLGIEVVARGRVANAFWLASGATRVQDEECVLAIERSGRAVVRSFFDKLVPPMIATFFHGHVVANSLQHDAVFDGRRLFESLIYGGFQRQFFTTPPTAVGCQL